MPIFELSILLQIACAIHVVKTGREIYWIFVIMFIPGIGIGIYFFTQILPGLGQSNGVNQAKNSLIRAIDPQRELRKRKQQLELANTLENKLKLGDECLDAGLNEEAIEFYQSCLTGVGEGDPDTMVKLAQAYFAHEEFEECKETLEEVIKLNPNYNSTEGHLLFARSLEKLQRYDEALKEYEVVAENYPGEEGRIRYGLLLTQLEKNDTAKIIFNEVISRSRLAPKFYQRKEKPWIKIAQLNLSKLK